MTSIHALWRRIISTRYTRTLEAEISRLRAENRALLNSILGIAGMPPIPLPTFTATSPAAGHSESPTLSSGGDESLSAPTSSSPQTAAPSDSPTRQSETRNDPSLSSSSPGTRAAARPRSLSRPTPLRRRSWHQINRMLEMESAKKSVTSDE
jgi:hypothetical protein